jgi:hypothetical protein
VVLRSNLSMFRFVVNWWKRVVCEEAVLLSAGKWLGIPHPCRFASQAMTPILDLPIAVYNSSLRIKVLSASDV